MRPDHVNLVPKTLQRRAEPDLQRALIYGWAAGLVLMALLAFMKTREAAAKEMQYQRLAETAKSMGASVQEITSKVKNNEEANRKFSETKEFLESRVTWTDALKELSLLIPNTVWLSSLETKKTPEKEHFIELVGEASSQRKVAGFLESLETSYFFRDVVIRKSEKVPDFAPDLYRFTFEIEVPQLAPRGQSEKPKK